MVGTILVVLDKEQKRAVVIVVINTICRIRYSNISDKSFTFHYVKKLFILIRAVNTLIFLMFSVTRGIYCTSVRPGRGIPHKWLSKVSTRFYLVVFPYYG